MGSETEHAEQQSKQGKLESQSSGENRDAGTRLVAEVY